MADVSQEKARAILRHGEVHGQALTRKQRGFFGARAGGIPMKTKNPPIFPLPNEPGFEQESDPLEGPAGSFVSGVPGTFAGKSGHAFDGTDAFAVRPSHPGPISDADFPTQATFTASTGKAFDRQEVR